VHEVTAQAPGIDRSGGRTSSPGLRLEQYVRRIRAALPEGKPLPSETWNRRHRAIVGLLWLHAAFVFCFGIVMGSSVLHSAGEASILAVAAALAGSTRLNQRLRAVVASLGLMIASGLLVHLSGGYIEFHFHFFVMVVVIALYQDWPPFLAAIGYVVLHHGVMGSLDPKAVYNHPSAWEHPWRWAAVHGLFILGASAASLVNWRMSEQEYARRIAEQERGEARLRQSEARFRGLVQRAEDIILILDADGTARYVSPSYERVLGILPSTLIGRNIFDSLHPDDRPLANQVLAELVSTPGRARTVEVRVRHHNDTWRTLDAIASNSLDDPAIGGIVVNARDVTERKELEEQLVHQAFHDSLTGLPNRALFMDRLSHALSRAHREAADLAVLYLDVDQFKVINDSLGHKSGDRLLMSVADRLQMSVRPGDTVARLGGDEFTVLLEDAGTDEAVRVARRIGQRLLAPFNLEGREVVVTGSIGIACKTSPENRPDDLLRNADVAMYAAKHGGKARFEVFDAVMQTRAWERLELEADLRHAVERNEFRVYYQPLVQLGTRSLVGIEALVRWEHPTRGLVMPSEFIPLAEETGLIMPIGIWVLEEACRQTRAWQIAHPSTPPLTISVNLSPRMLQQANLFDEVSRILDQTGLDPSSLKLEMTEGVMMHEAGKAMDVLVRLRSLGIRLAIDDFGTGYSSLAYLQYLPIDLLKIDRSFIARLGQGAENTAIVRTIMAMAETLNLSVIGEGVETADQEEFLQALGCTVGQGFFFSKPVPAETANAWFANGHTWHENQTERGSGAPIELRSRRAEAVTAVLGHQ
jgi:diguanylate cyclase (GGDEF)-like protein/PAS domain S-box-containing protein